MHGLIGGLSTDHEVSVLSLVPPGVDVEETRRAMDDYAENVVTIESSASKGAAKRLLQLRSLLSPWSYEWLVHRRRALGRELERMLEENRYDVVQFELTHMAPYGTNLRQRRGAVFVLDEHNIEYDIVRQTALADVGAVRRAYSAVDWRKVQREERRAWARLDGCALTSERDRDRLLAESPDTRTVVVPNGVDLDYFQPRPEAAPRDPSMVLFFGAIDYYPNTEALLYYFRDILPRLKAARRDVQTWVVGRRPPDVILARRGPGIEITGEVEDLRPYLERASVVIAPLRIGGGTRLKILEAMAMGKAVVSTSLGAEGLDVVPGRDILIADEPGDFAVRVGRLMDDPARIERLGDAARKLVVQRYGWQASVRRLTAFYEELLRRTS